MEVLSLIPVRRFLSLEYIIYIYKATIWPCLEYCCHLWTSASAQCLHLLDQIQNRLVNLVGSDHIVGILLPYRFSISISIDNAHLTFINWHLHSSLSLVTHNSLLILIIWLFSFLLVIRTFTHLVFFLVLLAYGTLFHVVAFLVSMTFRLLSIMLTIICLCLFILSCSSLPCSGLGLAESNLLIIKKHSWPWKLSNIPSYNTVLPESRTCYLKHWSLINICYQWNTVILYNMILYFDHSLFIGRAKGHQSLATISMCINFIFSYTHFLFWDPILVVRRNFLLNELF